MSDNAMPSSSRELTYKDAVRLVMDMGLKTMETAAATCREIARLTNVAANPVFADSWEQQAEIFDRAIELLEDTEPVWELPLRRVVLEGADLSDCDLSNTILTGADLRRANLEGARLSGANLTDCDLTDANLNDAVLRHTILHGATLTGAYLCGADLEGADLSPADLDEYGRYRGPSPAEREARTS